MGAEGQEKQVEGGEGGKLQLGKVRQESGR